MLRASPPVTGSRCTLAVLVLINISAVAGSHATGPRRFVCGMGVLCANAWDSQAKARCADAQTHDLLQQNVTVGRRWLGRLRMAMR